jgi:hypothetical protein
MNNLSLLLDSYGIPTLSNPDEISANEFVTNL